MAAAHSPTGLCAFERVLRGHLSRLNWCEHGPTCITRAEECKLEPKP